MSPSIQPLDDKYLAGIFDDLSKLEIQLDADPLAYGPKRLNGKVALARKMLTQCERMFLDVSQKHATYKRALRAAELDMSLAMKNLLANDPEVRAGRAVSEREAIATGKLKAEVQAVADATQAIEDLDAVVAVIKAKRSDLRDVQGRLRDQIRLCQEEIGLGNKWGSKSPRGVELQPGQGFADGDDVAAIEALLDNMRQIEGAETHLEAEVDDTDPEGEITSDLVAAAGDDEDLPVSPEPEVSRATAPETKVISGADLEAEFGFVPHCSVCGEEQSRTPSGMTCPNGHGGAESSPQAEPLVIQEDGGTSVSEVLPGTAEHEEVSAFLAGTLEPVPAPKKTRFQVEEEDGMDLDSLLANFDS